MTAGLWAASCAVPLGPGYSIERQEIRVQFIPAPGPQIHLEADYRLRNTGNRPLSSLELRLPGRRRFHVSAAQAEWDNASLAEQTSPENARETLLALPQPWRIGERHTLHLSAQFENPPASQPGLTFSSGAFFLPSEGWAPELLPSRGLFSTGGVPPRAWPLVVAVPEGFLIHTSGKASKTSRHGRELTLRALQRPEDRYPFVIAGRYSENSLGSENERIYLWTRAQEETDRFQQSVKALASAFQAYDTTFGSRGQDAQSLWIVECPVVLGCLTSQASPYAYLLGEEGGTPFSELVSLDTAMIDLSGSAPKLAAAAPSLAASWLGYGQNPGFYEQEAPLSALPAFVAAVGRAAVDGPAFRAETIRRALRAIPRSGQGRKAEDENVLRAKSFLFFYALQDRYGQEAFRDALRHMLTARRERGFNLNDLIAALGEETHQNAAEFVRLWMKHPGVPNEFRTRYEDNSAASAATSKESTP